MYIHWIKVSIPKWCDYKTTANGASIMHFFVSIPKWCDYKKNLDELHQRMAGFNSKMVRL